jgi:DNA-binding YbaB/EbfC family protein
MFNKGQLSGLMKQAQMMQENLKKAQDELALIEVAGEAASGKVKIEMTCKHVVKRVHIDPEVLDDKEMLEDLLTAAFNDATRRVEETSEAKMGKLSAGLPAGMKLPF